MSDYSTLAYLALYYRSMDGDAGKCAAGAKDEIGCENESGAVAALSLIDETDADAAAGTSR